LFSIADEIDKKFSIFHHGATAQQQKTVYRLRATKYQQQHGNSSRREDQIPTTAVFTWGTIVGHDLAAREVTELFATQQGPQ
jgi:hypothetical protein